MGMILGLFVGMESYLGKILNFYLIEEIKMKVCVGKIGGKLYWQNISEIWHKFVR